MSQVVVVIGGGAVVAACRRARSTSTPRSSPPTAGSITPSPPGSQPTVLLGDLDSISAHGKMWAYAHELEIDAVPGRQGRHRHRPGPAACGLDGRRPTCWCSAPPATGSTTRSARIAALGNPTLARFDSIRLLLDDVSIHVHPSRACRSRVDLPPAIPFSLLALHGPCRGVDVDGARWPLTDATLDPSSTRGVSNETTGLLTVAVTDGVLTVVVP